MSILPTISSCQPMKYISNLSTHVLIIIIKSQEKIKPVKWCFLNFNLNGQNFAECKNQDLLLTSSSLFNLHRVLFCTGTDHDDVMQIDCLAFKYFVFYRFSLVGYNIWYCEVCDYRGTPPKSAQFTYIRNQNF